VIEEFAQEHVRIRSPFGGAYGGVE